MEEGRRGNIEGLKEEEEEEEEEERVVGVDPPLPPWGEWEARTELRRLVGEEIGGKRWTELRRLATRDGRKEWQRRLEFSSFF